MTTILAWGRNNQGQLGDRSTTNSTVPEAIELASGVSPVAASGGFGALSAAAGSDGKVYVWGSTNPPQGFGTPFVSLTPEAMSLPNGVVAVNVSAGYDHVLVLGSDGKIYAWGSNYSGQLGDGTTIDRTTPEAISLPNSVRATAISAGSLHSLALGADGKVYAWGANDSGQLGIGAQPGTYPSSCSNLFAGCIVSPILVALPAGVQASAISAGKAHSLALTTDGTIYAWGDDSAGELGDGTQLAAGTPPRCACPDEFAPEAIALPDGQRATLISGGSFRSSAIGSDGKLYLWGFDFPPGDLGNGAPPPAVCLSFGPEGCAPTPTLINLPGGVAATAVSSNDASNFAIGADARIYAWGPNAYGQLGDGTTFAHLTPDAISLPVGVRADSVSAHSDYSLAIADALGVAPTFTAASPPLAAAVGASIAYTFAATGFPPATYALASGAPPWLSINGLTGTLSGTLPLDVTSFTFSVIATNEFGSATAGPFIVAVGSPAPVSGQVIDPGGVFVSGARVDACPTDGSFCGTGLTDRNGEFNVTVISGSTAILTAYPPATIRATSTRAGPFFIPASGLAGITIVLGIPSTLPSGLGLAGTRPSSSGIPILNWAMPTTATVTGCPNGVAVVSVVAQQFGGFGNAGPWDFNIYPLLESPAGSGNYTGTIPGQYPLHGPAEISDAVSCDSGTVAGARAALRLTNSRSAQFAPSDATNQVLELIHEYGPTILSILEFRENWKDIALLKGQGLHPTCETSEKVVETFVGLAITPLITTAVEALLPLVEAGIIALPGGILLLAILFAIAPTVVEAMVNFFAKEIIEIAVHAIFAALGCLPKNALIDPSGTVLDTNGNPVAGATTTILRSDSAAGPFTPVDPSGPGIEPAVNPETTGADGEFQWDVAAGFYEVQASAPNCTSPTDPTQSTVTIGPYAVPPPRTGLSIVLSCQNEAPAVRPAVTGLSVGVGPRSGGTAVTILGSGFTPQSGVRFGDSRAASVIYLSPSAVVATSPGGVGTVDVVVDTTGGTSAISSADQFFYGSLPTVTNLSTTQGPAGGGNTIGISGSGFMGATSVSFSGIPATQFTVTSDTEMSATVPPGMAGTVDVQVVNPAGPSPLGASDQYTYVAAAISALGTTINTTEGAVFSGSVGAFTTPDPNATSAEYIATIDWGDGTTNNGTIDGPTGGPFNVAGSHTYTEEGMYMLQVKITNTATPTNTATATSTATVGDAALTAGALNVASGIENVTTTMASLSFTDANPSATAVDFTATVDWGDGTTSSATISGPPFAAGGSTTSTAPFTATGSHTYTEEGAYTIKVSIADDGGSTTSATASAKVADAPVAASCAASSVSPLSFSGSVASVTDQNPNGIAAEFTTTIDWGDGVTTAGSITGPTGGPFTVNGAHVYGSSGIFTVAAAVADDGGSGAISLCRVIVYATTKGGNFVIGDGRSAVGNQVTFWSAQWAKVNSVSGGAAPAAFKGFETTPATVPACGGSWSTTTGDSASPPTGPLPQFIAVVVSGSISQSGSIITGDTVHVVVVETDPSYGSDPGHPGTGTIVAVIC